MTTIIVENNPESVEGPTFELQQMHLPTLFATFGKFLETPPEPDEKIRAWFEPIEWTDEVQAELLAIVRSMNKFSWERFGTILYNHVEKT